MTLRVMKQQTAEASPRFKGDIAAVFYLLTILTGVLVFVAGGRQVIAVDVIATAFYVGMTVLFYVLTRRA
jgi:hypothetical protein